MRSKRIGIIVIGLLALATSAVIVLKRFRSATAAPPPAAVRETQAVGSVFGYEIVGEYPHDADAYTQGLIYLDGFLYESTGITGRSSLRKVRLETGEVIQQRAVNPRDHRLGERCDPTQPVENLNELEFVDGKIYANVLPQDRIAIIQPDTGQVTGWIDLAELKSRMPPVPTEPLHPVMNGIAYDAAGRRLFVTGKLWTKVFEIRVRPQ